MDLTVADAGVRVEPRSGDLAPPTWAEAYRVVEPGDRPPDAGVRRGWPRGVTEGRGDLAGCGGPGAERASWPTLERGHGRSRSAPGRGTDWERNRQDRKSSEPGQCMF